MKEDLILQKYLEGYSGIQIAEQFKIKPHQVYYVLKKNNVSTRSNIENSRKYKANLDYFQDINTEEKAYWLGFIFADGSVGSYGPNKSEHVFKLDLGIKDIDHLVKFNKCLESNHPILTYTNKSSYHKNGVEFARLKICSKKFCDHLREKGCIDNKTNILLPPENLPESFERDFIRGYVDGDGSIKVQKNTISKYRLGICGTEEIIKWIAERIPKPGAIQPSKSIFNMTCHSDNVLYLYKNSSMYLDRKYERYLDINKT
jgi:DNA-binding transcriptional regulator WhiA